MERCLKVTVGQCSDKGIKDLNQDFHGVAIPQEPQLSSKGIVIALADGISSSTVSQIASAAAINGFLSDYYCTSETWSVKQSAQRVLYATNSWLHSQTRQSQYRYDKDKGYVCTFSCLIIKSNTAHVFHVGDTRVYRLHDTSMEQLTNDHRLWISEDKSYLSRALGIDQQLDIDYQSFAVSTGEIYILATDGVHEFVSANDIIASIKQSGDNLDLAAQTIVDKALANKSDDNLTIQILRIDDLPDQGLNEVQLQITDLPFPPELDARMEFDGYEIIRGLHSTSRSHVFLAKDIESDQRVILKIPSIDLRNDPAYLERFLMEEWIAKRIDSAHVLKPIANARQRQFLYVAMEFIEGKNLAQWMRDNPKPNLDDVRDIVEQIAKGLRAFHRLEMLHQDLKPDNIMIDQSGTVKIIDFGATLVAGLEEMESAIDQPLILGTAQYSAPEYFLGENGSIYSDQFSLGVITYQMLTGKLPYGSNIAKARSKTAQNKLKYQSLISDDCEIPAWIDDAIRKAVHVNPYKRYEDLSEFVYDLRHPSKTFLTKTKPPLLERNPVVFWQSVSIILLITIFILLYQNN
ncbi:MAG: bifunctional protein-serine/threonine kinase/phosphatase [Thalassolituus oleivorans]|uniref:bifunctional protein-serine/threonine kinase/phosphatase n=1 Tax=Thalassolituus oleivorans TaxID=187493 RepID=UPI001B3F663A|nr:bifunctional protein-serine/threonine kinase/phosphatase [Thalassolituus oleivorans]MBQ0725982.1 bifunctional protein-serine/threonine kinase/phosphatase [Thalassolituus oleivorans]MBQ0781412.1 bifunctional protein-serine/threonine kinase/phosphatase [Thalassolituus oleivorans]